MSSFLSVHVTPEYHSPSGNGFVGEEGGQLFRGQAAVRLDECKLELLLGHIVNVATGLDPDIGLLTRSQAGSVGGHMEQGGVGGAHLDRQEHLTNVGHREH